MAKYKLAGDGVRDTETGACIPFAEGNRHYQEYLEWVAEGNTPDPEFTPEEIAANTLAEQIGTIKSEIQREVIWLYKIVYEMWDVGIKKNLWKESDFLDPDIKTKADAIKIKLDELKNLGE